MLNFLKGIVVGLGGIAPGLSGSVLLILFGLYRKTLDALASLPVRFGKNIRFLLPLLAGMGTGVLLFSRLLNFLLEHHEVPTRFCFLGLILGTVPLFYREVKKQDAAGKIYYEKEMLQRPRVSYFRVFNAQQASGFPEYDASYQETEIMKAADRLIRSSKCPVRELAQDRAFYSPMRDEIVLPLRGKFKDDVSFIKTLVHEMCHSTAAPDRLNRPLSGAFGSPEYAKEELRAEIGALFTESDLCVPLQGEHYEDHSDYLRSWICALQNDYNEFFRACSDAEQISQYLLENYSTVSI